MARRFGGGRSAPRPAARPVRNPRQRAKSAPPPSPAPASSSFLNFFGGLGANIVIGLAGIALVHRAFDAVVGPRTIQHKIVGNEAAGAAPAAANNSVDDACGIHNKAFQDCLNNFGSDVSRCQFYLDVLSECHRNSGSIDA